MFDNLWDLAFERSNKQAFGRYIVYFFLTVAASALLGFVVGFIGSFSGREIEVIKAKSTIVGVVFVVLIGAVLTYEILNKKGICNTIQRIAAIFVVMFLAFLGGALISFIPLAYLTTRKVTGSMIKTEV